MLMWNTEAAGADGGLRSLNRGLTEIDRHHIFSIYPLNPVVSQYFPLPPADKFLLSILMDAHWIRRTFAHFNIEITIIGSIQSFQ